MGLPSGATEATKMYFFADLLQKLGREVNKNIRLAKRFDLGE